MDGRHLHGLWFSQHRRPLHGWLDHRHLGLALDLLHQPAGGPPGPCLSGLYPTHRADRPTSQDRLDGQPSPGRGAHAHALGLYLGRQSVRLEQPRDHRPAGVLGGYAIDLRTCRT